jgi:hypothetical protein
VERLTPWSNKEIEIPAPRGLRSEINEESVPNSKSKVSPTTWLMRQIYWRADGRYSDLVVLEARSRSVAPCSGSPRPGRQGGEGTSTGAAPITIGPMSRCAVRVGDAARPRQHPNPRGKIFQAPFSAPSSIKK